MKPVLQSIMIGLKREVLIGLYTQYEEKSEVS